MACNVCSCLRYEPLSSLVTHTHVQMIYEVDPLYLSSSMNTHIMIIFLRILQCTQFYRSRNRIPPRSDFFKGTEASNQSLRLISAFNYMPKNEIKFMKFNYTKLIVSTAWSRNCTAASSIHLNPYFIFHIRSETYRNILDYLH